MPWSTHMRPASPSGGPERVPCLTVTGTLSGAAFVQWRGQAHPRAGADAGPPGVRPLQPGQDPLRLLWLWQVVPCGVLCRGTSGDRGGRGGYGGGERKAEEDGSEREESEEEGEEDEEEESEEEEESDGEEDEDMEDDED